MEKITFKAFCNKIGYGPHEHQNNLCALAAVIGVHNSYLSRMYSEGHNVTEKNGEAFKLVKEYMASKGYELDYIPFSTRNSLNNQMQKTNNIFNVTLQKEYSKLNNKYEKLKEDYLLLKNKKEDNSEIKKLKEENAILKSHLTNLYNLIKFVEVINNG